MVGPLYLPPKSLKNIILLIPLIFFYRVPPLFFEGSLQNFALFMGLKTMFRNIAHLAIRISEVTSCEL